MLIFLAILSFAMAFQGSRGIWEPDEGRYTNIASQMLRTGDYLRPAFNDELHHFAKPPFTYWAIAGGVKLLGRNEWGVRLANALAFAGTVLVIFVLAGTITPGRPWLPPLVYASFLLPYAAANIVTTDTLLAFWEALGVLGFVEYWKSRGSRPGGANLVLMWFGFGLAFLTKGPPGLLPLLAITSFVALAGGGRAVARLMNVAGCIVFVIFGLGWYAMVAATQHDLATYFLYDEVVKRIATGTHHRHSQWYGGFFTYVPTLILGTFPWTYPLLRAARDAPRKILSRGWWRVKLQQDQWTAFLALWLLLPLAVFWISRSRLPLYILPLFPALALMTARALSYWRPRRSHTVLLAIWLSALVALKWGASCIPYNKDSRPLAHAIAACSVSAPAEVLFADTTPYWGVGFYLSCEVERVRLTPQPPPGPDEGEYLVQELATGEPGTILIARKERQAEIEELANPLGDPLRKVGGTGPWVFLAIAPAASPGSPSAPSGTSRGRAP